MHEEGKFYAIPPNLRRGSAWYDHHRGHNPRAARKGREAREILIAKLWPTGIPHAALARQVGLTHNALHKVLLKLRKQGVELAHRGPHWQAPDDWQARVDELMS